MSQPLQGFIGPSYALEDRWASVERCVNWYLVPIEDPGETKARVVYEPFPGNAPFSALPPAAPFAQRGRGILENRGSVYGVNGTCVYLLLKSGAMQQLGTIVDDGKPVSMTANGSGQIGISSGGRFWVFEPAGWAAEVPISAGNFLGSGVITAQDGYVIAVTPNSNQFQISGNDDTPVGDMRLWDAANVSIQAGQADNLLAVLSSREYLRLFGERRGQVYQNVGNSGIGGFPFQSYNSTFIETGLAAAFGVADLGESVVWIGRDARGQRAAWRDVAFQPQRISTFAVELAWDSYPTVEDAIIFPYIWAGHLMVQFNFPSAAPIIAGTQQQGATWLYDATASQLLGHPIWTERNFTDATGRQYGRPEMFHCYSWGKHLVVSNGWDGYPGAVYQWQAGCYTDQSIVYYADGSSEHVALEVVRDRICPHIWSGYKRIIINRVEFELPRGVGLDGAPAPGTNPQLLLRWSKDGGNTWSAFQSLPLGQIGRYLTRCYFTRLGYARDWVLWIRCSDSVYNGLVNAMIDEFAAAS